MDIEEIFEQLGLSDEESSLYVSALELGETLVLPLSKYSGLTRTVIYRILPKLQSLGLISYGRKGRRQTIIAEDPISLLNLQEARIKEMRTALPKIMANLKYRQPAAMVRIFEGVDGIKQVYEDTLKEDFSISSFLEVSHINPEVQEYLLKSYVPRRVKHGIRTKNLVSGSPDTSKDILPEEGSHRENRYVDPKTHPAPMELLIYGNKVAFVTYREDQRPMAIVIENGDITQTLRSLHKMGWNNN